MNTERHWGLVGPTILAIVLGVEGGKDCYGQADSNAVRENEPFIFEPIETMPEFPGGEKEMYCFMDSKINKALLTSVDTMGVARVMFTINTTGQVTDVKVLKSLTEAVDNELVRIISLMPAWTPGEQRGKVMEVRFILPLKLPYEDKHCK